MRLLRLRKLFIFLWTSRLFLTNRWTTSGNTWIEGALGYPLLPLDGHRRRTAQRNRPANLPESGQRLFLSAASFWEICIKESLGKIALRSGWIETIQDEMTVNTIQWLPIEIPHCIEVTKLPFHHRDPCDRMLIAQAMVEDMQLLSRDSRLSAYAVAPI